ncbi:aminotransferase class I/II-fold pyridoxal phosphate-dependent enzyme [Pseudoclavibacter sp. 13-3]|uniref:aminotransferase class I/II-fold pyridoxal phosphate-dependent enzyme n=1 Tax=Pseudoclavibacter sp. 13-3 TaxID=2901228 RepID=UPI001E412A82|nr:aminotransferase class I/II-fold pyridoxal phosphate-dependent enzyme [Pseudoclavibacter sp. 13-3]MCD7102177.1 aminotransferase class I/II-fold pyridoxal phosphate-dependent enzyme [Pseudoclavibacter sp. 13-3]
MTSHEDLAPHDERSQPWRHVAAAVGLLNASGQPTPTIFAEMTNLAVETGSVNLGQGFPDASGPQIVLDVARQAIADGVNQYPPGQGLAELRLAVAEHQRRFYGLDIDPDSEVLITTGATEALAATLLALTGPGDEVITLDPCYDAYTALIALSGARQVRVPLTPPTFDLDLDRLEQAFSDRTRIVLLNNPHNPTGTVIGRAGLTRIVELAKRFDALIVTDEVYEHLVFDDAEHTSIGQVPGAAERSITISSAGKTFSVTGWKIGWLTAPAHLRQAVQAVKQFLTFTTGAPFQPAVAAGLRLPTGDYEQIRLGLQHGRDILHDGLVTAGFESSPAAASYFCVADGRPLGFEDATELARLLPERCGVVAIPLTAFAAPEHAELYRPYLRFAFSKQDAVLQDAAERLQRLRG